MSEWKKVKISECVSQLGDGLHGTPQYTENGEFAFINGNNFEDGVVQIKTETKRVDLGEYQKYKKDLTNRTLFVSINGTLGNVAKYNDEKVILGKSACYLNIKEEIEKDFIFYILKSPDFQQYLNTNATGTTIQNVSLKQMRDYEFSLPDLQTQKKIAGILGSLDDKIELNNRINANLEQQAQALFKEWFVDNANPEWKQGKLEDIGTVIGGGTPSKAKPEYYIDSGKGVAWITPKDLSITHAKFTSHGES